MAFPNLTVRAQLDAAGITRGVQQTVREFSGLRSRVRQAIGSDSLLPDTEDMGRRAAEDLIRGLREQFRQAQAQTREQLFAGLINRAEARRQGQQAGIEMTRGLQAGIAELERRGLLSPSTRERLVREMRGVAIPAGRATAESIAEGIESARAEIAQALDRSLTDGVRQARAQVVRETGAMMQDVGRRLQSAGRNLSLFVTAPLVAAGGLSIRAAAQVERLELGLTAIAGSAEEAARQLAELEQVAELPGIGFREAVEGATALQVLNFSAETTTRTLRAFGNAIALTGGGQAELQRVIIQLTQMAATGRVLTQDLRPIIQTAPAVGRALQNAFGTVNAQDIEALGLTFDQFLDRLLSGLEDLPPAAVGVAEGFERMRDDILLAQAAVGEQMVPAVLDLQQIVEGLSESIREMSPETIRWGISLGIAAAAIGPLVALVGTLTLAAGGLAAVLGTGLATVLATGGGLALGLGALATLLIQARLEMAAAQAEVENFNRSLRSLSLEAAQDQLTETRRRARELREELATLSPGREIQTDVGISIVGGERFAEVTRELELTEEQTRILIDRIGELTFAEDEAAETGRNMAEELTAAFSRLGSIIRESDLLGQFGAFDLGQLPEDIRESFRESESLRGRLRSVEEAIEAVVEAGGQVPQAATERVRQLQRAIEETDDELQALVSRLGFEGPEVSTLAVTIGGVVIENPDEVRQKYEEQVRQAIERETVRAQLNLELQPVVTFAERQGIEAERPEVDLTAFNEAIEAVRNVTRGIGDMAAAMDDLDGTIADLLRGVETLITGLATIRAGEAQGGVLGGLAQAGGFLSLASGFASIANALNENSRELVGVRAELRNLRVTNDRLEDAERAALAASRDRDLIRRLDRSGGRLPGVEGFFGARFPNRDLEILEDFLRGFDLSLGEFLAIAQEAGIQIVQNGQIVTSAFEELVVQIRNTRQELVGFEDTLAGIQQERDIRDRILGIDRTGQEQAATLVGDLQRIAPDLFREFFAGVDLSDLESFRAGLLGIFDAFADREIDLGPLTRDEFLDWIERGTRAVEDWTKVVEESVTSLRNVPEVFNFTLASLRAAGTRDFTGVNAPINPQTPDVGAPPHTEPRTSGPTFSINVEDGAIRIDARTESEDLTDAIVRAVVEAIGRSGRTLTPSDIEQIRRDLKPSLERAAGSLGTRSRDLARDWPG